MSAAEGRKKIVKRHFVGQIGNREAGFHAQPFAAVPQVIGSDARVKDVSWGDARRIGVVVLGTGARDIDAGRTSIAAAGRDALSDRRELVSANLTRHPSLLIHTVTGFIIVRMLLNRRPLRLSRRPERFDSDEYLYELKIDGVRA